MTNAEPPTNLTPRAVPIIVLLAAAFVASLVTANLVSSKIVTLGGLMVPAGVLAYSITFAVSDTLCEVWGRRQAQAVVNAGFLALLLVWALVALAVWLPPAPFWSGQAEYAGVLGSANRIILASLAAYLVSQTLDVWEYDWLKRRFSGRYLWLRNNGSTFVSQTVDTVVFITLAFYGQMEILPLIGGQLLVKYAIALLDTPVVYALVYLVRARIDAEPADPARQVA